MAAPPLLQLDGISLTFGGTPLLTDAGFAIGSGERLCLVGRNGSGKSTLLKIAAGLVEADAGRRFLQPGATLRYLPQEPDFTGFVTVSDYVVAGLGPTDDPYAAQMLLEELGLTGREDPAALSGGEARRSALARTLAPAPDILLLDEPTNHLDLPTIEWLEERLKAMRSALVLISHDRRFLANLTRATIWLDRGVTRRLDRGFAEFEAWRDGEYEREERERHKLDRKIAAEEDWVRYGVTARRKRNVRRMGELADLRRQRREARRATGSATLKAAEADASGAVVVAAEHIGKSYDGHAIVRDFSARVARGERIGVVGPNGAGKTTLLSLLTGRLAPDSGEIRLGAGLDMAALEQDRTSLNPDITLSEALTGGRGDTVHVGGEARHVMSYMKDFLFSPEQARTPLHVLSGGERARVMLARALARPSNCLVLDEPTNDLDLETLDVLEEMLSAYAGTIFLVSHDRDFLDRIVDAVIAPEGDGRWTIYAGGYADMLAQRGDDLTLAKREAGAVDKPVRERESRDESHRAAPVRKLTFKDKHALETLPANMARLETDIARAREILADPGLYARDRALFDQTSAKLATLSAELAAAEEQWLELELRREELANG